MTDSSPDIIFLHPTGSRCEGNADGPIVRVPGSAGVALDRDLASVWMAADGRNLAELAKVLSRHPAEIATETSALSAAGLLWPPLSRKEYHRSRSLLPDPQPLVSVIIASRDGRHHLAECLPSLRAQTYRRHEVIVVDDGSKDGTQEWLGTNFPEVRVLRQAHGPNFPAACNLGIANATGEFYFLLNNDTVLDPHCLEELMVAQAANGEAGGVGALMCFHDNRPFVNGLGTFVPRRGFGHDLGIGSLDVGQFERVEQVPFLCFGAALIARRAMQRTGVLDEAYEFYYEDADWGYRARALGFDLLAAPRARVYHKFGASTGKLPSAFKTRLTTRNRLRFTAKNLPAGEAVVQIASYAMEDVARLVLALLRGHPKLAGAILQGWRGFLISVLEVRTSRRRIWSGNERRPRDLARLALAFPRPEMHGVYPRLTRPLVRDRYRRYLYEVSANNHRQRVLVISPDSVDTHMGGVGIRYWELAGQLAGAADVTLAIPNRSTLTSNAFSVCEYKWGEEKSLARLALAADIILLSGFTVYHHPFLREAPQRLIVDLYDPMILENLERFAARPPSERASLHQAGVVAHNELFRLGDFFVCASEKQRDYWLGALSAANRVDPEAYSADPTLRRLIDVVPFGLPDEPPVHERKVLKGVVPGIGEDDAVILWGGGVWDWLDPLTAIDAMPAVLERVPRARLFFLGTKHPNPAVPPSRMAAMAEARAAELGLKDRAIFFNDWVPYASRGNYLREADVGISLHGDHIETRFAVRTRLMDYFWARLPMVITGGDTLSDLVAAHQIGRVAAAGDVAAVAQGLIDMLERPVPPQQFEPVIEMFGWPRVALPLLRYLAEPTRTHARRSEVSDRPSTPVSELPGKAVAALRTRGVRGLARDVRSYLTWLLRR